MNLNKEDVILLIQEYEKQRCSLTDMRTKLLKCPVLSSIDSIFSNSSQPY